MFFKNWNSTQRNKNYLTTAVSCRQFHINSVKHLRLLLRCRSCLFSLFLSAAGMRMYDVCMRKWERERAREEETTSTSTGLLRSKFSNHPSDLLCYFAMFSWIFFIALSSFFSVFVPLHLSMVSVVCVWFFFPVTFLWNEVGEIGSLVIRFLFACKPVVLSAWVKVASRRFSAKRK